IVFVRFATQIDSRTNVRYALPADLYAVPVGGGPAVALTQTPNVSEAGPAFRPGSNAEAAGTTQPCIFEGTSRRDVLRATPRPDLVDAGPGNDVVYGRAGGDVLDGGPGDAERQGGSDRHQLRC